MIVGCYTMDLYCDAGDTCALFVARGYGGPTEWTSGPTVQTESAARVEARADGWHFERGGSRVLCPRCWKAGTRFSALDGAAS